MSWKPYPKYKGSGVEWLDEIPKDWELKRLKDVSNINSESLSEETQSDWMLQYVDIGNVNSNGDILDVKEMTFFDAPSRARRKVKDGDTIISTVRTYLKAISFISDPPSNLIVSTGFAVLRTNEIMVPKFLWRVVQSKQFVDAVVSYSEGVSYPAINPSLLACLPIWIPSKSEQIHISNFLDRETARIDALIEKKQRQIELLQEKRTAVISHAVTKGLPAAAAAQAGLDPNVPMKDSGVEWLGEIPAHWEIKRLKFLTRSPIQYGANESAEISDPNQPRYIRITDITGEGKLREDTFRSLPHEIAKPYLLKEGDLLLARSGATVGKSFLYDKSWGTCCYAGYLIRARLNVVEIHPRFLNYFTSSKNYWDWISSSLIQATIQNVSAEKYANMFLAIPKLQEQKEIIDFLDEKSEKITNLIAKISEAIDALKEYRIALISDAVTGKIDVRDYDN